MGYGVPAKTMSSEDVLGDAPALSVDFLNVEQRAKDRWAIPELTFLGNAQSVARGAWAWETARTAPRVPGPPQAQPDLQP
jgi:hypothetical protein